MTKTFEPKLVVSKDALKRFIATRKRHLDKSKEAIGSLGGDTDAFIEKHGCHKWGLAKIMNLNEMPPEKRADALRTFDSLRGHLQDEWSKQAEMALEQSKEEEKETA